MPTASSRTILLRIMAGEGKIMLRKHKGVIVEMVLLKKTRYKFSVINFTGNMSEEFYLPACRDSEAETRLKKIYFICLNVYMG
jgi:hypothetical protein